MTRLMMLCVCGCLLATGLARLSAEPPDQDPAPALEEVIHYRGKVVGITAGTITIKAEKFRPVVIPFSDVLGRNERPKKAGPWLVDGPAQQYVPREVRVGDLVEVTLSGPRSDSAVFCEAIMILRRPGGRVPPAPGQEFDLHHPERFWSFRVNAYQAEEEFDTPLPDCLVPPWQLRRAPMPRAVLRLVAPMPRPVPAKP